MRRMALDTYDLGQSRTAERLRLACVTTIAITAILLLFGWANTIDQQGLTTFAVGGDFGATLIGARIIRDGNGTLLYDPATQQATQAGLLTPYVDRPDWFPYNHTPLEALIIAPLIALPYPVSYLLWLAGSLLAVSLAIRLLWTTFPLPKDVRWLALGAVAAYPFLHSGLWLGQNTPFVLLGLCGLVVALHRERFWLAGVALALVALKPQLLPILLLLLVFQRRWQTLWMAFGTLSLVTFAMMPWLGIAWPLQYARLLVQIANWSQGAAINTAIMLNWRGFSIDLVGGWSPWLTTPLEISLSVATVAWLGWCWWRARHAQRGTPLVWGMAIIVALLIAPHTNPHELTLLIVPFWLVAATVPLPLLGWRWLVLAGVAYSLRWLALLPGYPATTVLPSVTVLALFLFSLGTMGTRQWVHASGRCRRHASARASR